MTAAFPPVPLALVAARVPGASIRGGEATEVSDAAFDTRDVTRGALFFCVPGRHVDGHDLARAAVAAGASAIVVERWLDLDVPQVAVPSVRPAMGPMSAEVFGRPAESMTTVGVTGTNGKTTITYLLESVFTAAGWRSGVVGTTGARIDGDAVPISRTTPEAPELQRLLALMRDREVRAVAIEVSSHALSQHRTDGIVFDVVAFTNLSQDHLDHHGSMERYFAAKARLFSEDGAVRGVVNVDDEAGRRLIDSPIPITTFAVEGEADVRARNVVASIEGLSFDVDGLRVRTSLRGDFNVSNVLAAIAIARLVGVEDGAIVDGVAGLPDVPGRMERVEAGQGFLVVVDYAHTPASIRNVLRAARPLASGRLIIVFGCGGERDRSKRRPMGAEAASAADLTVITTDNPRSEDPLAIIDEIVSGAKDGGGAYVVEPDRRSAIRLALGEATSGDVVVIAGKGHEPYQEVGGAMLPFDDRAVAREELEAIGGGR